MDDSSFANAADPVDTLIVGAGPAGIAAACVAAEAGREVVLLDDNPDSGGQIWRGGRRYAPGSAAVWFDRLAASGARVLHGSTVVDAQADGSIVTRSQRGIRMWKARAVILATGSRERFIPFPGWTLPGVVGAGGLQALVKQGLDITGKRIIIAGTGPLLLAVADLVVQKGGRIEALVEQAPFGRLARFAASLVGRPEKIIQAIAIRSRIGIGLRTGSFPEQVHIDRDRLVVSFVSGPSGRERRWERTCDMFACGFGLVPNLEVARLLGCEITAGRIRVDPLGRTTVAGVLAAGEGTGVGGVEKSLLEGRIAGLVVSGQYDEARRLASRRRSAERFADALDRGFMLDPRLATLADDATIVCRCEDVTAGRLRCHGSWREAKLMTRIGMGPCQGRICGPATEQIFGWSHTDVRPPLTPVSIAELGAVNACPTLNTAEVS